MSGNEQYLVFQKVCKTLKNRVVIVLTNYVILAARLLRKSNLASRSLSVLLISALLLPMIYLGNIKRVSAQGINSNRSSIPIHLPPPAYKFNQLDTDGNSPFRFVSNAISALVNYVTTPKLSAGFEAARPVSPLLQDIISSISNADSSIGTFFGFVVTNKSPSTLADGAFPADTVPFDFDYDLKADFSSWNPATGVWKIKDDQGNLSIDVLGTSTSVIVPGDFDGDGKTDKAVWTAGVWTIRKSSGGLDVTHPFGIVNFIKY